ncbi:MAG TPA: tryptophan--tRNA ligase [Acidobacteriaceae bacterium]
MPETPRPTKKRILSGMRPTGRLHLGNYMGALKNWVALQDQYECFFFVADIHALTTDYADPSQILTFTREVVLDWLGAGLDPERSTIFVQSKVKQHLELSGLLAMITPLSWLERVPTYKDQIENLKEKDLATYGFLGYPLLQSADILLYGVAGGSLHVPVGADQVAHVEITREIARRFDFIYENRSGAPEGNYVFVNKSTHDVGHASALRTVEDAEWAQQQLTSIAKPGILSEPQVLLTPTPKLPGTDGRKMSKSYGNYILLSDPEPDIRKKLKPMVTDPARVRRSDPGNPDVCPVGDLHKVFSSGGTLARVYDGCTTAAIGCIECKSWLADAVVAELAPMQERRARYEAQPQLVTGILEAGNARAREAAEQTMTGVRRAMGLAE